MDVFLPAARETARHTFGNMLPQYGSFGEGDGSFVFLPQPIDRERLKDDLGKSPEKAFDSPYAKIAVRARERGGELATPRDLDQALDEYPYAGSPKEPEFAKRWTERVQRYRTLASAGDAWAAAALHVCASKGLGMERNDALALQLARDVYAREFPEGLGRRLGTWA